MVNEVLCGTDVTRGRIASRQPAHASAYPAASAGRTLRVHSPSTVDDFGTNRKRVYDFLLVGHCDYGPILHRFLDTAIYWLKIAYFSYPSLIRRPSSLCSLWNFALQLSKRKLESWCYPPVRRHDPSLSRFDTVPACVGRTDRQTDGRRTDGFTIASTALCIASYADAL